MRSGLGDRVLTFGDYCVEQREMEPREKEPFASHPYSLDLYKKVAEEEKFHPIVV